MTARRPITASLFTAAFCVAGAAACNPVEGQDNPAPQQGSSSSSTSVSTSTNSDGQSVVSTSSTQDGSSASSSASISSGNGSNSAVSESRANGARSLSIENDLFEFSYEYPASAGKIPALARLLDGKLDAAKAELEEQARDAQTDAAENDFTYRVHSLDVSWQTVTDLPNWLSLSAAISTYGGGAHGNLFHDTLVWDKRAQRALKPLDMFTSQAALRAATQIKYCAALDEQRTERGGPIDRDSVFGECPSLDELTLWLGSRSGSKFDRIELMAAPYIAGSYAEGTYSVVLPVDAAIMRAVKPQYRSAFAAR